MATKKRYSRLSWRVNEMKKWKAAVSIMILFLLGAAAGALVTHKIDQERIENILNGEQKTTREFIVQRLNRELDLDATQLEQLRAIVRETHTEVKNVRRQIRPQIEEILSHSQDKVRAILRPDQRVKFEQIIAERRKKRETEENSK